MLRRFIHFVLMSSVRIFYRRIEVSGAENLPDGAVLLTANHANGLLDPLVIRVGLKREFGFLAKSTLFENPAFKVPLEAFGAVPVFRSRDGNDTSKNNTMFQICRDRFAEGRSIVMFPEGTSHSDPQMKKLKTGAARIALSAQAEGIDVHLVPVGLFYDAKSTFRSRVSVAVGEPLAMSDFMESYQEDDFATALEVTDTLATRLGEVVLQADSVELWETLVSVAQWTDAQAREDISIAHTRAQALAKAYETLSKEHPKRAHELAEQVLQLNRMLQSLGVKNPLDTHASRPTLARIFQTTLPLILMAPFALVGVLSGWVPYRLFGPVSRRIAGSDIDIISTVKVLLALVFMPLIYATEAAVIGYFSGWHFGVIAAVALPICGLAAVRYGELLEMRRRSLKVRWLRLTRASAAAQISERRMALSTEIQDALSKE